MIIYSKVSDDGADIIKTLERFEVICNVYSEMKNEYDSRNKFFFNQSIICLSALFFLLIQKDEILYRTPIIFDTYVGLLLCKLAIICFGLSYLASTFLLLSLSTIHEFHPSSVKLNDLKEKVDFIYSKTKHSSADEVEKSKSELSEGFSNIVSSFHKINRYLDLPMWFEKLPISFFILGVFIGVSLVFIIIF